MYKENKSSLFGKCPFYGAFNTKYKLWITIWDFKQAQLSVRTGHKKGTTQREHHLEIISRLLKVLMRAKCILVHQQAANACHISLGIS